MDEANTNVPNWIKESTASGIASLYTNKCLMQSLSQQTYYINMFNISSLLHFSIIYKWLTVLKPSSLSLYSIYHTLLDNYTMGWSTYYIFPWAILPADWNWANNRMVVTWCDLNAHDSCHILLPGLIEL